MAQTVCVSVFCALIAQSTLVRVASLSWEILMAGSIGIGVAAGLAYRHWAWFRTFLTFLIPAPLVFAMFFLATPPVSGLVFPASEGVATQIGESDVPVVFVVFDEFPVVSLLNAQGGIDAGRYPNIARLATTSTWHKYTAAAHDYTWWALPPILTGQSANPDLLPTAANFPGNLFTLLDDTHEMHVVEPFTRLCPPETCGQLQPTSMADRFTTIAIDSVRLYQMLLAPNATRTLTISDPFNEFRRGARGVIEDAPTDQVGQFTQFVDQISTGTTLHYLHLLLPHAPFGFYPSGSQYNDGEEMPGRDSEEVWLDPVLADLGYQRHLLQVQMLDRLMGDLLERLEEVGILDDALLVVTADHGASFLPGQPRRAITDANAYEVGLVPLFIKLPGQDQANVETSPVRTMDVLPTVADALDIEIPWEHDGTSLLDVSSDTDIPTVRARAGGEVALTDVEQGVRDSSDRMHEVFGTASGSLDPYSVGDYDLLLGATPDEVQLQSSGLSASVDEAWRLSHVAPRTGFFVPGFLHGDLIGPVDPEAQVAVSVNGEIRTVIPVFDADGSGARFNAIIPDEAFVAGFNDLSLFQVSGSPDDPELETIALGDHFRFEMEVASSGRVTRLISEDGRFWPIDENSPVEGTVDEGSWHEIHIQGVSPLDLYLNGWALDAETAHPVERVVFFADGVYAGSVSPGVERLDIAEAFETEEALISGFVGRLSQLVPSTSLDLRVFALSGGVAEELPVTDEAQADIAAG
jgi:hypothetical protein